MIALSAIAAAGFYSYCKANSCIWFIKCCLFVNSGDGTNDEELAVGNIVSFAMSTTTSGGIGISSSLALSLTTTLTMVKQLTVVIQ